MFSVILQGRNAGHGHNLHKRAAIGRNFCSQVLAGNPRAANPGKAGFPRRHRRSTS